VRHDDAQLSGVVTAAAAADTTTDTAPAPPASTPTADTTVVFARPPGAYTGPPIGSTYALSVM